MNIKLIKILVTVLFCVFFKINSFEVYGFKMLQLERAKKEANDKLISGIHKLDLQKVHEAIKEGADIDIEFEVRIITIAPNPLDPLYEYMSDACSAVCHAGKLGRLDIVKYLVESGASKKELLFDVLSYNRRDFNVIKYVVELGLDVNAIRYGKSPIYLALARCDFNAVKLFVYHGADLCGKGRIHGKTILEWATIMITDVFPEYSDQAKEIEIFLKKHAARVQNIKNKNLKYIAQKVNQLIQSQVRTASIDFLPLVLGDLVVDYSYYPENFEDFFKLSDQEIDEMLKIYSDEFEKKEINEKVKEVFNRNCLIM